MLVESTLYPLKEAVAGDSLEEQPQALVVHNATAMQIEFAFVVGFVRVAPKRH